MRELGHRAHAVADGAQAVAAAARGGFDVILMDVHMPGLDGLEAARRIRALGGDAARVPIIALTASGPAGEGAAFRDAGMDDVVAKPIDLDELTRALARATRR